MKPSHPCADSNCLKRAPSVAPEWKQVFRYSNLYSQIGARFITHNIRCHPRVCKSQQRRHSGKIQEMNSESRHPTIEILCISDLCLDTYLRVHPLNCSLSSAIISCFMPPSVGIHNAPVQSGNTLKNLQKWGMRVRDSAGTKLFSLAMFTEEHAPSAQRKTKQTSNFRNASNLSDHRESSPTVLLLYRAQSQFMM